MNTSVSAALLLTALCLSIQSPVRAESHSSSKATTTKVVETKTTELKGSKQLIKNDNLIPTQNRTQAMAVESTTGHLPGNEDAVLAKQKSVVKTKTASKSRKNYVRTRRGMSHAAIRRGILDAARNR